MGLFGEHPLNNLPEAVALLQSPGGFKCNGKCCVFSLGVQGLSSWCCHEPKLPTTYLQFHHHDSMVFSRIITCFVHLPELTSV